MKISRRPALLCTVVPLIASAFVMPSCRTAGIRRAYMALDSQAQRPRTVFFTDTESIYCVAEVVSGRADVTVQAAIVLLPRQGSVNPPSHPAVVSEAELAPGKSSDTFLSFKLQKLDTTGKADDRIPYPPGKYRCDLSIDGELEESLSFEVQTPDCPARPAYDADPCLGWVATGAKCVGALAKACSCQEDGRWHCS